MTRLFCYLFGCDVYCRVGLADTCVFCGARQAATEWMIWLGGKLR